MVCEQFFAVIVVVRLTIASSGTIFEPDLAANFKSDRTMIYCHFTLISEKISSSTVKSQYSNIEDVVFVSRMPRVSIQAEKTTR
jgi:hypothetical protein